MGSHVTIPAGGVVMTIGGFRPAHITGSDRRRWTGSWLAAVTVLALVVLAGCTGVGGHPTLATPVTGSPSTPTPGTATAAGTTTEAPTGTGATTGPTVQGTDAPAASGAPDTLPSLPDVTAPAWQPTSRTDELTVQLGKGGPSVQAAVDAANLVTPVPGATPTSLPAGDGLGPDITMALVATYRAAMAPDQQEAVAGLLATRPTGFRIDANGAVTKLGHGLGKSAGLAVPAADPMNHVTDLAGQAAKDLRATAPAVTRHGVVQLFQAEKAYGNWTFSGMPDPHDAGVWDIVVYPRALDGSVADATLKLRLVTVLFEASEFAWNPKYVDEPAWLTEGAATFAAYDTYRAVPGLPQPDQDWFAEEDEPLAYRTADAWAFFASLKDSGGDPYLTAFDMVSSGKTAVADLLAAGGVADDSFAAFRSSQAFRHTGAPPPLIVTWPQPDEVGPTDNAAATGSYGVGEFTVTDAGDFSHALRSMTFSPYVGLVTFTPDREVLTTAVDGRPATIAPGVSETFCIQAGGCTCPSGEQPAFRFTDSEPPLLASLPEVAEQNSFLVQDRRWEPGLYCGGTPTPAELRGATAVADPHLTTFDGARYDLMDLGEFVAVRDPQGGLEVQDRTQPYDHSTSGITAVAIGTRGHRITVTTGGITDDTWVIRLDGTVTAATSFQAGDVSVTVGTREATAGAAATAGQHLSAVWPDGSEVDVTGCCGMWLDVRLPPQRAARVVGLLGSGDGNIANDLRLPNGTRASGAGQAYAHAWYVTDQTSLFDYDPGKNTESYRGPLPPLPPEPTDTQRQQCADTLGANANGADLQDCAYDLASTGNTTLVQQYAAASADRAATNTGAPTPAATGAAPAPESSATTPAPTGVATAPGPEAGGTPWLTLSGTVVDENSVPYGTQPPAPVTGSIQLPKDTVLVIRAARCLPQADIQVSVTLRGDPANSPSVSVYACDPSHYESYDATANATVTDGEVYVMITTAGVYDLKVFSYHETAIQTSVAFYADPTPTVVSSQDIGTKGYTGAPSGIGDTVVATVVSAHGGSWKLTGGGTLCRAFNYAFALSDRGPTNIGADCWHNPAPTVDIPVTTGTVYLIFSRDAGSQQISLIPGP